MARREHGAGSIFQRDDKRWVGQVNVAPPGAARKRRTVYGKTRAEVVRKLAEANDAKAKGDHSTTSPRFSIWLDQWLARADLKPRTRASYSSVIEKHIKPVIGNVKIGNLRADHVHALHDSMSHLSTTTARNAHRIAGAAMNEALSQQRAAVNPFGFVKAPAAADTERPAMTATAARAVIDAAKGTPMESRWLAAIYLGMRPGECLGLTWDCVDFRTMTIDLTWQLQTARWAHGCDGTCGHRPASCPERRHDVSRGFRYVPVHGTRILQRPKTDGSTRIVPMLTEMVGPLQRLRTAYLAERDQPGYHDHGLVWHRGNGLPLHDAVDRANWHALLRECKLPKMDLYSGRHTAATLLLENGVDAKTIGAILGHSLVTTTQGYQHVDISLARHAVESLRAIEADTA